MQFALLVYESREAFTARNNDETDPYLGLGGRKSQPIIFMTAPFARVLVFCKLKLTRHSLGAVVVMKSGTIAA